VSRRKMWLINADQIAGTEHIPQEHQEPTLELAASDHRLKRECCFLMVLKDLLCACSLVLMHSHILASYSKFNPPASPTAASCSPLFLQQITPSVVDS
jgi:hypothetical protein